MNEDKSAAVSDVTRQLIERDQAGRKTYGTSLDRSDLSLADWLQHMAEELLDAAGYALAAKRTALSAPQPPAEAQAVATERVLSCGCVLCVCDDPDQCHGCGAKGCDAFNSGAPCGNSATLAPPPSAPVGVSSTEREWLQYAIDHMRDDNEPEDATCADVLEALLNRVESAPVGVEGLDAAAVEAGHITFESMKQCADAWFAVVDALNAAAPGWNEKKGTGRECATAAIAALAQQPAAVDGAMLRDAERYRALVASGKFAPSFNSGWALATGTYRATKGELDAAADALAAQQGGSDNDR